jgi:hypothetical protein
MTPTSDGLEDHKSITQHERSPGSARTGELLSSNGYTVMFFFCAAFEILNGAVVRTVMRYLAV